MIKFNLLGRSIFTLTFFTASLLHGAGDVTLEEIAEISERPNSYKDALALVERVFQSQRVDLAVTCFQTSSSVREPFLERLEKEPSSEFRARLLLRLLEEPWPFDSPTDGPSIPYPKFYRIFMKIINDYVDGENLEIYDSSSLAKLDTVSERKIYAHRLRGALEAAGVITPAFRPEKRPDPARYLEDSRSADIDATKSAIKGGPELDRSYDNSTRWTIAGLISLAVGFAIWFKRRSSNS